MFTEPHLNTRGGGRILHSYANPLLRLGFPYNYQEYFQLRECLDEAILTRKKSSVAFKIFLKNNSTNEGKCFLFNSRSK